MRYFFILGANPALSIAEISAVFGLRAEETKFPIGNLVSENVLIMETGEKIDAKQVIKKMGGTIKIGIVSDELKADSSEELLNKIIGLIDIKNISGKFKFGASYYGKGKFNIKPLGMEIKKYLREKNISCRWVTSREPTLSSVVVEQNKLTDKGIEIVLINSPLQKGGKGSLLIGQTLAVQPFKELSFRDYGRPARDDRSGMLPPKLAQIMINLAMPHPSISPLLIRRGDGGEVILDPFCGSGTILTEAMLMGIKNLIGSDISAKAIKDTEKNIKWVINNYQLLVTSYQLLNQPTTELSKFIKLNSVDAIITEPYLGPQRGKVDFKKITVELENLYSKSLTEFKKILKPRGRIVIIFPVFQASHSLHIFSPNLNGFKIINPLPENLRDHKFTPLEHSLFSKKSLHDAKTLTGLTKRDTIIYGREGQKVWREIVVLGKI